MADPDLAIVKAEHANGEHASAARADCPECPAAPAIDSAVEEAWRFWAPLVVKNGALDLEAVKCELHDFSLLLDHVPKVYMHITGGRISKPNTLAEAVIEVADEVAQERQDEAAAEEKAAEENRAGAFIEDLRWTINRHSRENGSNTPDLILAEYLASCLKSFDVASNARERWYGVKHEPGTRADTATRAEGRAEGPREAERAVRDMVAKLRLPVNDVDSLRLQADRLEASADALRALIPAPPTGGDERCTCGSGAHPRRCLVHPERYAEHGRELSAEYAAQDERAIESRTVAAIVAWLENNGTRIPAIYIARGDWRSFLPAATEAKEGGR